MRRFALLLIFLASACGSGGPAHDAAPRNVTQPAPGATPPAEAPSMPNAAQSLQDDAPDNPGLAGLSPAQRRAYDLGYRDCSHGRYAPDNHLEAYRIGCGAAHDQAEGGRPQG
jgi:hypothetical protein